MRWAIAFLLCTLTFAGCLSDDEPGPDVGRVSSSDVFFEGVEADADLLASLSPAIYEILPVEEIYLPMSDGAVIHNAVYRPDTDEPTPVFINFSPYHGDTAEQNGDGFGSYMIANFVPRGYTVVLTAIRGTGHSSGCFEVASDREVQDLNEVVDYFATQPWSNGAVGAGGKSYDSTTQNGMIANHPHPALKTIFHVSGITDMYRYTFMNGVPARADSAAFSAFYSASQGINEYGGLGDGDTSDEDLDSLLRLVDDVVCIEMVEHLANPTASTLTGLMTPYWIERDWTRTIGDSDWAGSIFFYHGFQDWNVQPSHILPWIDNLPEQIAVKGWMHQNEYNGGHVYPMRTDWNLTMLQYLDSELKGIDNGFWDTPDYQLEGSDQLWRWAETWPPAEMIPLDDARRYSGEPVVYANVTATGIDPVFTAVLWEDTGSALAWRNEAVLRLLYRDSLDLPNPVIPGSSYQIAVPFYAQDDALAEGSSWHVTFQEHPAEARPGLIITDLQLQTLMVDDWNVVVPAAPLDALVEPQPIETICHTC